MLTQKKGTRIKNLLELKEVALRCREGSSWKVYNRAAKELTLWSAPKREKDKKVYNLDEGKNVVMFYHNGDYYFVPYKTNVFIILAGNGFEYDSTLQLPFDSINTYPYDYKNQWFAMVEDDNGKLDGFYGILPPDLLRSCYQITEKGQEVSTHDGPAFYKPFDEKHRGYYSYQNDVAVFVTYDGKTYVAPHEEKLIKELEDKGYEKDEHLWVPFANDDCPVLSTPEQRVLWAFSFGE